MAETTPLRTRMLGISWLNMVIGAVVFITPFVTATRTPELWSGVLIGLLIVGLEVFDVWAETHQRARDARGPEYVNALAGAWLVLYPLFANSATAYLAVNVGAGLVLIVAALTNAALAGRAATPRPA